MPVRIDHRTMKRIILGLQKLEFTILLYKSSTMATTNMKGKLIWIGTIANMTVEARTRHSCILNDRSLIKIT